MKKRHVAIRCTSRATLRWWKSQTITEQQRGSERGPNLRSIVLASMRKALKWLYHRIPFQLQRCHHWKKILSAPPVVNHFWFSKEAMALFRPVDDESVLDAINNQIKVLEQVNKGDTEYIDVIENLNQMNLSEISTHQVFCLRQKCLYLVLALKLAKQHMRNWRWQKCVEEASKELENIGIVLSRNARTVMGWYNSFRVKRKFTLPVPKKELPPFLQQNPELCTTIKEYCRENLGDLSIEFLFQYLHKTILPQLVEAETKVRKDDMEEEEYQKELRRILKPYRLVTVCMSTVQRWLHLLGFKYELRKKSYYVDGHEKPATIQYRHDFCKRYLGYEQRMH